MSIKRMAGVTLVELIIAIAIMGAALAGLMVTYNRASIASADPLITQQMLSVAETMMEEIMQKPFAGDGLPGKARREFDEITDYATYQQTGITNVNDDAVAGLARYSVAVTVDRPGINGVPAIGGVNGGDALRIRVRVSAPGLDDIGLTGWRTRP